MNRRIRRTVLPVLAALLMSLLAGCGNTSLAEGFSEKTITETAEKIINEVNVKGAKEVLPNYLREGYAYENDEEFPVAEIDEQVQELLVGKGEFMAYTQETVIGKKSPDNTEDFGVILVTATYEKGEINYTLTFDKDMRLISFYPK